MKIPDRVLDLMLVGAIGAICLIPHGTKTAAPMPATQPTASAPNCAIPVQTTSPAKPVISDPATPVAQPILIERDPCPGCGRG